MRTAGWQGQDRQGRGRWAAPLAGQDSSGTGMEGVAEDQPWPLAAAVRPPCPTPQAPVTSPRGWHPPTARVKPAAGPQAGTCRRGGLAAAAFAFHAHRVPLSPSPMRPSCGDGAGACACVAIACLPPLRMAPAQPSPSRWGFPKRGPCPLGNRRDIFCPVGGGGLGTGCWAQGVPGSPGANSHDALPPPEQPTDSRLHMLLVGAECGANTGPAASACRHQSAASAVPGQPPAFLTRVSPRSHDCLWTCRHVGKCKQLP